jgi:hypothetical protein
VNVVAWVDETGWEAVVDAVALLADARVTLLCALSDDVVEGPAGALAGMLGRRRGHHLEEELSRLTAGGAEQLLDAAARRLGAPAGRVVRTGRIEREVLDAAAGCDLLALSRASLHPGPRSIGHAARFVVDHAPCRVLLVWPGTLPRSAPDLELHPVRGLVARGVEHGQRHGVRALALVGVRDLAALAALVIAERPAVGDDLAARLGALGGGGVVPPGGVVV